MRSDNEAYDELVATSAQRTVFAESWWLDAATGPKGTWNAHLLRDDAGHVAGAWPLVAHASEGSDMRAGAGAPYTPILGPLLPGELSRGAYVEQLEQLAEQVASYDHVESACSAALDYWTPLAWHGFEQTTRTTWRIEDLSDLDRVRRSMRKGRRSDLAAATKAGLQVDTADVATLLEACSATFGRQGVSVPNADVLERVASAALERERGEVLAVRTSDGEMVSAGIFVWDDQWTWNLANGRVGQVRAPGAPTLLIWAAIQRAAARATGFDFEGSMLQSIEPFFRSFGGTPVPYSVVRRSTPRWRRRIARRRFVKRALRR